MLESRTDAPAAYACTACGARCVTAPGWWAGPVRCGLCHGLMVPVVPPCGDCLGTGMESREEELVCLSCWGKGV